MRKVTPGMPLQGKAGDDELKLEPEDLPVINPITLRKIEGCFCGVKITISLSFCGWRVFFAFIA